MPDSPPAKRPSRISPTQRTLAECRGRAWTAQVVERWNAFAGIRVDLFDAIDVVACAAEDGNAFLLGIQACSGSGGSPAARMEKAGASAKIRAWLACGGHFEVWAWRKTNDRKRGARKLWRLRRVEAELCGDAVAWHEVEGEEEVPC